MESSPLPPRLMGMPTEVLEQITGRCDARGLGALRQTCRALRGVQDSLMRQLFRQKYAGIVRHMVEDISNRSNAIIVELQKDAEDDADFSGLVARGNMMPATGSAAVSVHLGEEAFTLDDLRKPDQFFVQAFAFLSQDLPRRPDDVFEICVNIGSNSFDNNASLTYQLFYGLFITDLVPGEDDTPFVRASKMSFETHALSPHASLCSALAADVIIMFHNAMLHYFPPIV